MKLTKEEIEEIRKEAQGWMDYQPSKGAQNVLNLITLIDHLEERVRKLAISYGFQEPWTIDSVCTHSEFMQKERARLLKENMELQSQLDQLREACGPIVEKLEQHDSVIKKMGGRAQDDIQWYTDIPLPIARRIAELVKGGK